MRTRLPRAYATRAGWARTLAAFALALGVAVLLWRRWELIDFATFELVGTIVLGLALVAILLALVAAVQIFTSDARGLRDAVIGLALAGLVLLPAALTAGVAALLPPVAIAATSVDILREERALLREGEGIRVGGADLAAYPDILPLALEMPSEDVFAIVETLIADRGWRVLEVQVPTASAPSGRIRAVARTPVLGFLDDIVVRIEDDEEATTVDALSASRVGQHDLGTNARRLTSLLDDIAFEAVN